jgi:hypothetical protein
MTRPNAWGKILSFPGEDKKAAAYASSIRRGKRAAFAGAQFDAEARNGDVWVRYVGPRATDNGHVESDNPVPANAGA